MRKATALTTLALAATAGFALTGCSEDKGDCNKVTSGTATLELVPQDDPSLRAYRVHVTTADKTESHKVAYQVYKNGHESGQAYTFTNQGEGTSELYVRKVAVGHADANSTWTVKLRDVDNCKTFTF